MSVTVHIPTPLRQYVGQAETLTIEGKTVGDALHKLTSQYPDLKKHLYSEDGNLRSFINIYVNDEDVRYLERNKTPLKESDEIRIIPSIAGGSAAVAPNVELRPDEILRYSRHLIMPEVGTEGQKKLKVLLVSGSLEYKSDESLAAFQKYLEANYPVECVRAFRKTDDDLPGLEHLETCDELEAVAREFAKR